MSGPVDDDPWGREGDTPLEPVPDEWGDVSWTAAPVERRTQDADAPEGSSEAPVAAAPAATDEDPTASHDDDTAVGAAAPAAAVAPRGRRRRIHLPAVRRRRDARADMGPDPYPEAGDDPGVAPQAMPQGAASRVSRRRIMVRRGVVVGLLVVCVLLLTAFFREGEGGFLHSLKGTATDLVSPVQDVGATAVKPVRGAWNWFADLRDARRERDRLRTENAQLRTEIAQNRQNAIEAEKLRQNLAAQQALAVEGPSGYTIKTATVINRPLFETASRARINLGRGDGVTVNSLVFVPASAGAGQRTFGAVVGRVTRVDANASRVTFITDPSSAIAATIQGTTTPLGLLKATPSGQLLLSGVPASVPVQTDQNVVTLGIGTSSLPSPYPPGLLIGRVTSSSGLEPSGPQTVQVTPFRDPVELDTLTILIPTSQEARARAGIGG